MKFKIVFFLLINLTIISSSSRVTSHLQPFLNPVKALSKQPYNMPYSSMWPMIMKGADLLNEKNKIDIFVDDCNKLSVENKKITSRRDYTKTFGTDVVVRIATYNVHIWADPRFKFQKNKALLTENIRKICTDSDQNIRPSTKVTTVFNVIEKLDADILLLQEAASDNLEEFEDYKKILKAMGYEYGTEFFGNMNEGIDTPYGPFGNWILSRYPFVEDPQVVHFEKQAEPTSPWKPEDRVHRCVIHAKIKLPNDQIVSIYVTHLDAFDVTESTRLEQIKELVELVLHDSTENILLAGDLNSIRPQDYQKFPTLWESIVADSWKREVPTPTDVLDYLKEKGFVDSFSLLNRLTPGFTTWSGTTIDFLMPQIAQWKLSIIDSGVYFDSASDHIPVFMDIKLDKKVLTTALATTRNRSSSAHR